jgi:hypothetical protein
MHSKMTSVNDHFMSVNSTVKEILYYWKTAKSTLLVITEILKIRTFYYLTCLHIRFNDRQLESSESHKVQMVKCSSVVNNIFF